MVFYHLLDIYVVSEDMSELQMKWQVILETGISLPSKNIYKLYFCVYQIEIITYGINFCTKKI